MTYYKRACVAGLAALLMLAPALGAAGLDRRVLPAGTKWFIHVDFDALRDSALGRTITRVVLAQPGAREAVENIRSYTGTDVLHDLHGLTIFNTSFEQGVGVIVLRARLDRDKLLEVVRSAPDHASEAHGDAEIHRWTYPNADRQGAGAIVGDDTIVLGQNAAAVGTELDLIGGKGAALADEAFGGAEMSAPGMLAEAGATGLPEAHDLPFESPIVRESREIGLRLIDHDGQTSIRARLVARSAQVADQVRSLVQGFKALVQLQNVQEQDVMKLLDATHVTSDGDTVRLDLTAPTADMVKLIHEAAARQGHPIGAAGDPPDETPRPAPGGDRAPEGRSHQGDADSGR